MLDLVTLDRDVLARLASDSAGAALRAALGAGAAGVMVADALMRQEVGTITPRLPKPPFVALRRTPVPITDRIAWLPSYLWYCYGSLAGGSWVLSALPPLIDAAYQGFDAQWTGVGSVEISAQTPTIDSVLGLWVLPVTLNLSGI